MDDRIRRIYTGWGGEPAHPDSPAGGGGPGYFRQSCDDDPFLFSQLLPHPDSPAGRNLTPLDISRALNSNRNAGPPSVGFDCKKAFFQELLGPVEQVARQYDFDPNCLLALSALESGWLGPHAHELQNALGLTKGGGPNQKFKTFSESVEYWGKVYGEKVRGSKSIYDFIAHLQTDLRKQGGLGKYNSVNPQWETEVKNTYLSVAKRRGDNCK